MNRIMNRAEKGKALVTSQVAGHYDLTSEDLRCLIGNLNVFDVINAAYYSGFYMGQLFNKNEQKKARKAAT